LENEKIKGILLKNYAEKDLHRFTQFDGWRDRSPYDSVMRPDEDGDVLCRGSTMELRNSPEELAVRVFVHEGTSHGDALRLLKKILGWMASDEQSIEYQDYNPDLYEFTVKCGYDLKYEPKRPT
jgi:hypothetical protein